MPTIDQFTVLGDVASVGLLFGIFYRMGVFSSALDAISTRVTRLEGKTDQ